MPLAVERLCYTYAPGTPFAESALTDVTLAIQDGDFVGVMGRTGCGKTTFIHLLAGLLTPDSGRVLLDGADINAADFDRHVLRGALGVVFQYPEYQLFETTVGRDVAFGLRHMGLTKEQTHQSVCEALETVGLDVERVMEQSPMALSGGEKRLVAIAGVLAAKPRFLVFDEPIAGLDPLGRESFLRLVARLNAAGTTVVMVSHNAESIAEYAKRVLVFDAGRLVMDGTPREAFMDVARMTRLHIGVSEPRRVAHLLMERGFAIARDVVRYDELLAALQNRLKGGARA